MSSIRDHLLLPPLDMPDADPVRTDPAALRNAANLYDQLRAKGYSDEHAERMCRVARLNGFPHTYNPPQEDTPA